MTYNENNKDTECVESVQYKSNTATATVPTAKKICNYDDFVEEIGEFGLWQKFVCFLLWFPAAAGGIHVLMYSFTGLTPSRYRSVLSRYLNTEN